MTQRKYSVESIGARIDGFLGPLLASAGFELRYKISDADAGEGDFETPDLLVIFSGPDVDTLLANRAELLLALEQVTMEMLRFGSDEHSRLSFDANDYRLLRIEELRLSAQLSLIHIFRFPSISPASRRPPKSIRSITPRRRMPTVWASRSDTATATPACAKRSASGATAICAR